MGQIRGRGGRHHWVYLQVLYYPVSTPNEGTGRPGPGARELIC